MILFERVRWGEVGFHSFVHSFVLVFKDSQIVSCVNSSLFQILNSELDKRLKEEDKEGLNQLVPFQDLELL